MCVVAGLFHGLFPEKRHLAKVSPAPPAKALQGQVTLCISWAPGLLVTDPQVASPSLFACPPQGRWRSLVTLLDSLRPFRAGSGSTVVTLGGLLAVLASHGGGGGQRAFACSARVQLKSCSFSGPEALGQSGPLACFGFRPPVSLGLSSRGQGLVSPLSLSLCHSECWERELAAGCSQRWQG